MYAQTCFFLKEWYKTQQFGGITISLMWMADWSDARVEAGTIYKPEHWFSLDSYSSVGCISEFSDFGTMRSKFLILKNCKRWQGLDLD